RPEPVEQEGVGARPRSVFERLSPREHEIVAYLASGESNKGIAAKLGITERTVKAHLSSIFQKTGLKDRLHLALAANAGYAAPALQEAEARRGRRNERS
ncbi:MAG TPA: helix-turn-helix transcriptional regulator, partial [Gammaproteobacteria bacterium]|nr:helix-turn-helix transcriptional regulator [Gammaproteobacteria bacterium]